MSFQTRTKRLQFGSHIQEQR
uniref:Uncharacterized protein n=1 Tax=Rhizophora mucronata TaxID=61149 RepID=A0A2P2QER8_RHIMU